MPGSPETGPAGTALPYFDAILKDRRGGGELGKIFERYVHWGYWEDPLTATATEGDFREAMERLNKLLLTAAGVCGGQKILDAGCGFGGTLASIDAAFGGMDLTGLNIDARQLAVARSQVTAKPGNKLVFVEGDACKPPFPDASFDRVLAVECIFHFPSRRVFLEEAARLLKPGGLLALSDFVSLSGWRGGFLGRWLESRVSRAYGTVGDPSEGSYADLARAAGLEVVLDRDITAETLPTYDFLLGYLAGAASPAARALMQGPTRWLAWLSRLRLVRYRVLAFRKP